LYGTLRDLADVETGARDRDLPTELIETLADDLNTPEALSLLARLAENARKATSPQDKKVAKATLLETGAFLGLLQQDPEAWFKTGIRRADLSTHVHAGASAMADLNLLDGAEIDRLIAERDQARKEKNFARADEIRDELQKLGIAIEDGAGKTRWKVATG
jgi:cysteinyl-tRNA synthetase